MCVTRRTVILSKLPAYYAIVFPQHLSSETTGRWLECQESRLSEGKKCLAHHFMKPHLDSRSNFNRYQHSLATVTVDRSFVKNGKSQDAGAVVLGEGRVGKKAWKY